MFKVRATSGYSSIRVLLGLILLSLSLYIQMKFGDYPPTPYIRLLLVIFCIVISFLFFYSEINKTNSTIVFSFFLIVYFALNIFIGVDLNAWYKNKLLDDGVTILTTGEVYTKIDTRPPSMLHRLFFELTPCVAFNFKVVDKFLYGTYCSLDESFLPNVGDKVTVEYSSERIDIFRLRINRKRGLLREGIGG